MRLGSLCSGAGGLDMAVERVFGAETVWHCETDPAASKVLEYRWPGVPNYGDLKNVAWGIWRNHTIDILTAGWPCQPFSLAGKQKGADDERAIWPQIARAIFILRPGIVVLENVPAVLGSEFGRVANSLAALGYDLRWTCLRAGDVGAPHRRERLFVVAYADSGRRAELAQRNGQPQRSELEASQRRDFDRRARAADVDLLPTPAAARSGRNQSPSPGAAIRPSLDMIGALLPTPRTSDTNGAGEHGQGGLDLRTAVTLLPTPTARLGDGSSRGASHPARRKELCNKRAGELDEIAVHIIPTGDWGKYEPAIRRWESLTRPAPSPTEPNTKGNPRLNPAFSEWMMGWPAGWVTQVPGISRNDQLRIIGNGVVPQCAAAALTWVLSLEVAA